MSRLLIPLRYFSVNYLILIKQSNCKINNIVSKKMDIYTPFPLLLGVNAREQAAGMNLTFVSDHGALIGLAHHVKSYVPERVIMGYSQSMVLQTPAGPEMDEGDFCRPPPDPPISPDKDLVVMISALEEEHITERLAQAMYRHPVLGADAGKRAGYNRRLIACGGLFVGSGSVATAASEAGRSAAAILIGIAMPLSLIGAGINYIVSSGPARPLQPIPVDLTPPIRIRSKSL